MKRKEYPRIRNRIRYCRMGTTQKDIAFIMGKSATEVSKWETGRRLPNVYNAIGLSVATNRLVEEIFLDYRREWQEKIEKRKRLLKRRKDADI